MKNLTAVLADVGRYPTDIDLFVMRVPHACDDVERTMSAEGEFVSRTHPCDCGTRVRIARLDGVLRTRCPICGAAFAAVLVPSSSDLVKAERTDDSVRHWSYRGLCAVAATVWSAFVVYYAATLTMHETGAAFGGWCGTCVAGARYSLFITNPLLLSTSMLALIFAGRLKSRLFPLIRILSTATLAIVISPICTVAWAVWIERW